MYPVHSLHMSPGEAESLQRQETEVQFADVFSVVAQHGGLDKVCLLLDMETRCFETALTKNACMQVFCPRPATPEDTAYPRAMACLIDLSLLTLQDVIAHAVPEDKLPPNEKGRGKKAAYDTTNHHVHYLATLD